MVLINEMATFTSFGFDFMESAIEGVGIKHMPTISIRVLGENGGTAFPNPVLDPIPMSEPIYCDIFFFQES